MKVALVTGNRADLSAIDMLERALRETRGFEPVRIDITPKFHGNPDPCSSASEAMWWVGWRLREDEFDLAILHGDRFEILAAAVAANISGVPIAHLSGGDLTEGSQDDCYRHAITKLSHLHFPSNEDSARRLIQMGEDPARVYDVGCPGIDRIAQTVHMSREETFAAVGLNGCERAILVALHPDTLPSAEDDQGGGSSLDPLSPTREMAVAVREALTGVAADIGIVLTGPNGDAGSEIIDAEWKLIAANRPNTVYRRNYDSRPWLSLMAHCDLLVGNSSCGFYEAPSLALPVVNIGDRQKGRIRTGLVYDVCAHRHHISTAISGVLLGYWQPKLSAVNPYGDGHACERIVSVLNSIEDPKSLLRKVFYDAGRTYPETDDVGRSAPGAPVGDVPRAGNGAVREAAAS